MRTDAKIGFAIVGVLLAVLAVYAVVIPRHGKAKQAAAPADKSQVDGSSTGTGTSVSVPPPEPEIQGQPPVRLVPPPTTVSTPPTGALAQGGDPVTGASGLPPLSNGIDQPHPSVATSTGGGVEDPAHRPVDEARHASRSGSRRSHNDGTAVTPPPSVTTVGHVYRVRPGQTLSSIAAEVYGDSRLWTQIQKQNPGLNPSRLKVGTKIMLPDPAALRPHPAVVLPAADVIVVEQPDDLATNAGSRYTVKAGDSLYRIAKRFLGSGHRADALYELNRDAIGSDPTRLRLGMTLRLPTADGALSDASR